MIQLMSVKWQNFMCFGKQTIQVSERGLVGILGQNYDSTAASSNGAGKSAFFEAIHFALQGKTLRGLKVTEILRRGCAEEGFVEVTFTDSKYTYAVTRYFDSRGTGKLLFLRLEDSLDLVGESKRDTQKKIDQVLGMSFRMFKHVVLFGQGGTTRFSDLGDTGKKELVEEILGLALYERAATEARRRHRDTTTAVQVKQRTLKGMDNTRVEVSKRAEVLTSAKKRWLDDKDKEKAALQERRAALAEEQAKKEGVETVDLKERLEGFALAIVEVDHSVMQLGKVEARIETKYRETLQQFQATVSRSQAVLIHLKEKHERLDSMLFDGVCPTCGRATDQDLRAQAEPLPGQVLQAQIKLGYDRQEVQNLHVAWEGVNDEHISEKAAYVREKTSLQVKSAEIQYELQSIEHEASKLQDEIVGVDRKIKQLEKSAPFPQQPELVEAERYLGEMEQQIAGVDKEVNSLSVEAEKCKVLAGVFGAEGIRSFLFETLLDGLNKKLREYSGIVSGGQLQVALSATSELVSGEKREKITVQIENQSGGESYQSNSSGEQRRLDLPIAFALQDLAAQRGIGLGVCLLDEVFEHVDETGVTQVVALLEHIAQRREHTRSVFVVTHNEDLKGAFPNVWTVSKDKGVAHIEGA